MCFSFKMKNKRWKVIKIDQSNRFFSLFLVSGVFWCLLMVL